MARTMTAAQMRAGLAECLRRAERGEEIVICRHGKPVAVLGPVEHVGAIAEIRGGAGAGLAALAGGWKGSEEFVRTLGRTRRSPARRPVRLEG